LQHFCREAIRHFRNLLVTRVCGADSELVAAPEDERPRLAEQAARFSEEDLTRFFNTLLATDAELRRATDPRLHLELGLLKLINARRLAPLEEVLAGLRGEIRAEARGSGGGGDIRGGAARTASAASSLPARATPAVSAAQPVSSSGAAVRMAPATNAPAAAGVSPAMTPVKSAQAATAAIEDAAPGSQSESAPSAAKAPVSEPVPPEASSAVVRASNEASNGNGIGSAQVEAIKAALQGQKFLWSMLDAVTRWELENGELRLFFPSESRSLAEMLQARDPMERLRTVLNQVVGQPLRVCVKLDSSRGAAPAGRSSELRARFEKDPIVRAMLEKFGGQISKVKRPGEE
jgi:DNA polymerase-3 subunit gamma/tau